MKAIILFVLVLILITVMSLSPVNETETHYLFKYEDKLVHMVMYATMAIFLAPLFGKASFRKKYFWMIVTICSLYGALVEILQSVLDTGRLFEKMDIVANIFGAFAGTVLIYMLNRSEKINGFNRNQSEKTHI